ncbi:phospholipid transport system transporter-binding protein [Noviherbaspirillum humi]|uniref:Phospholipid transport system transporter-binding protein n=1 Tax=Noviherbaspirillum humi TaxID=1688639 RepID=A0A239JEA0_9BURK|nr:STAS domain-containing protein [Noviherbaspirillum humi]SNT03932.1 phospholipid transport system transporter-binding protein [Noviherbaspirillum humi]
MFQPEQSLTFANAAGVMKAGLQAISAGQSEIDLGRLQAVDSAAVATLLCWQRAAAKRGAKVRFTQVPANLQDLIHLYDLSDLLHQHH